MSGADAGFREEAVLILAPTAKDAAICRKILEQAGVECAPCRDVGDLCAGIDGGAGVALLGEEALTYESLELLRLAIRRQPAWSDFPLLVLTEEGADSEVVVRTLEILGNVTLLERPVRVPALVSAVRAALRARRRQHQIRDYLAENDRVTAALREADRRKDEFLAILAHELRNPLAPLRNALEAMRLKPHDREAATWARGLMERQLAQMVRLIDDLLDLSRVSRGRIELRHERVELRSLAQAALDICRSAIESQQHRLTLELPAEPLALRCDPTRLVQVISNLLSNAAKYTPPGGRITLAGRRQADGIVEISVCDSGIGIPRDMLGRVFEMFTQVPQSLERSQGGLGIGLTLVKRLVELHGGSVEARSEGAGLGAEFVVRLPEDAAAAAAPSVAALPPQPQARRQRILVADDNRDAADSLTYMLRIAGHDVRTAYDGQQALEIAETYRPAVALVDLGMPRLNGYDTARRLRARPDGADLVLIALTGWGQPEDRNRSLAAGFDHHVVKPVDPSLLERLLAGPPGKKKGPACRGRTGPGGGVDLLDRPLETGRVSAPLERPLRP